MTDFSWINEPARWQSVDGVLRISPASGADLWSNTMEPGSERATAPMYGQMSSRDFVVEARVTADFRHQYDQVGLVVYQDPMNWLKCGVEIMDGSWDDRFPYDPMTPVVNGAYTRMGWSEWSVVPPAGPKAESWWFRLQRVGASFICSYSIDGDGYSLIKVCSLPDTETVFVGRYAASPIRGGFEAVVDDFSFVER